MKPILPGIRELLNEISHVTPLYDIAINPNITLSSNVNLFDINIDVTNRLEHFTNTFISCLNALGDIGVKIFIPNNRKRNDVYKILKEKHGIIYDGIEIGYNFNIFPFMREIDETMKRIVRKDSIEQYSNGINLIDNLSDGDDFISIMKKNLYILQHDLFHVYKDLLYRSSIFYRGRSVIFKYMEFLALSPDEHLILPNNFIITCNQVMILIFSYLLKVRGTIKVIKESYKKACVSCISRIEKYLTQQGIPRNNEYFQKYRIKTLEDFFTRYNIQVDKDLLITNQIHNIEDYIEKFHGIDFGNFLRRFTIPGELRGKRGDLDKIAKLIGFIRRLDSIYKKVDEIDDMYSDIEFKNEFFPCYQLRRLREILTSYPNNVAPKLLRFNAGIQTIDDINDNYFNETAEEERYVYNRDFAILDLDHYGPDPYFLKINKIPQSNFLLFNTTNETFYSIGGSKKRSRKGSRKGSKKGSKKRGSRRRSKKNTDNKPVKRSKRRTSRRRVTKK